MMGWLLTLLFAPVGLLGVALFVRGNKLIGALHFLIFGFASFLIFLPELSSNLANSIGIGRGTDLVLYLFIPFSLLLQLLLYLRVLDLERKNRDLVSRLAIELSSTKRQLGDKRP